MARTVSVILDAKIDGFVSKMAAAGKAAASIGDSAKQMTKGAQREFEVLKDTAVQHEQSWNKVSNTVGMVGVAAAAVGGVAVKEFAQFDQAMSGVASTGADAKASIDALRDSAIQQGADTAYSATEAAQGIEELARAGVTAEEILGGGLSGALSLAAAGQIGVADAAGIASTAMTQFKLSGEEIPHLADLLAAGAGKAMGGVGDLGQALGQSGLVAAQFGLDIEETVGGLSAFAAAGLLGSDAGTSFKNMLLKLAKPSKQAQTLMDEMGISAYDAQGQFVGLEGLAGQLQGSLSGLTEEQRNSTLATIFGTDAIRAAAILYENGAEGIAEWTSAVDDSGYAARTAAELQNNLVGDLEKLGGSWSTFAIQMGETANGPLRMAVQGLTALVDIAGETPGAATGLMATATGLAALALGGAALMKGISGVAAWQTSIATLSASSPGIANTATMVGKLGKALGVAGLAVGAMQLLNVVLDQLDAHGPGIDATATALTRIATGLEGAKSLDLLFRDADDPARQLTGTVGDLGSALDLVTKYDSGMDMMWQNFLAPSGAVKEIPADVAKVTAQFEVLDSALSGMTFEESTSAFAALRAEFDPDGSRLPELMEQLDGYATKVDAAAAAAGLAKPSQQELAALMSGEMVQGFQLAADGTVQLATAQDEAVSPAEELAAAQQASSEAMQKVVDAANSARDAIQSLNDSQTSAANAFMNSEAAQDKFIASLQAVKDQIKENGTSTDEYTEKGRANREYLRGLATDARTATDAMVMNGEGIGAANEKMVEQRAAILGVLGQFGIVGAEATAYADSVGLIPNYVETTVAMPGAKLSAEEANELNAALEGIDPEIQTQIITIAQLEGADEAMAVLGTIDLIRAEPEIAPDYIPDGVQSAISSMNGIPNVEPKVIPDYIPAGVQSAISSMNGIPNVDPKIISDYDGSETQRAKSDIASVQGKTVTITVNTVQRAVGGSIASQLNRAQGGPVYGPGTTTSDSIPANLSNREWVLRAWAADRIGHDRLAYMNATGKIPHFNTGGQVTPQGPVTTGRYATNTPAGGGGTTNITYLNVEGREAFAVVADQLRYADRIGYQTEGVHRG